MQIAPRVDALVWHNLKLHDPNSSDWVGAIGILERLQDCYIQPMDFLIASEENKLAPERRFGFTVLV